MAHRDRRNHKAVLGATHVDLGELRTPSAIPDLDSATIQELSKILGCELSEPILLQEAVTSPSVVPSAEESYLRLEYIGDSVLTMAMNERYFTLCVRSGEYVNPRFEFDRLLSNSYLTKISDDHGLEQYIRSSDVPGKNLRADVVEALLGAVFLDSGFSALRQSVSRLYRMEPIELAESSEIDLSHASSPHAATLDSLQLALAYEFNDPRLVERILSSNPGGSQHTREFDLFFTLGSGAVQFALTDFMMRRYPKALPAELSYLKRFPNGGGILASENGRKLSRALRIHYDGRIGAHYRKKYFAALVGTIYVEAGQEKAKRTVERFLDQESKRTLVDERLPTISSVENNYRLRCVEAHLNIAFRKRPQLLAVLRRLYPDDWHSIELLSANAPYAQVFQAHNGILPIGLPYKYSADASKKFITELFVNQKPSSGCTDFYHELGNRLVELKKAALYSGSLECEGGNFSRLYGDLRHMQSSPRDSEARKLYDDLLTSLNGTSTEQPVGVKESELLTARTSRKLLLKGIEGLIPQSIWHEYAQSIAANMDTLLEAALTEEDFDRRWKRPIGAVFALAAVGHLSGDSEWHARIVKKALRTLETYHGHIPRDLLERLRNAPLLPYGESAASAQTVAEDPANP